MPEKPEPEPVYLLDVNQQVLDWMDEPVPADTDQRGEWICRVCKKPKGRTEDTACKDGKSCNYVTFQLHDLILRLVNSSGQMEGIDDKDEAELPAIALATGRASRFKRDLQLLEHQHKLLENLAIKNRVKVQGEKVQLFTPLLKLRLKEMLKAARTPAEPKQD